jgi:hypothetical protein
MKSYWIKLSDEEEDDLAEGLTISKFIRDDIEVNIILDRYFTSISKSVVKR